MSYTPGTPLPNQTLASSQPEIRNNFLNLTDTIGRNHVPPTDRTTANRGKHNIIQLPQQASGPSTSSTEGALYTKAVGGSPNLFWRKKSSGTEIQLTSNSVTPVVAANGSTFLPGGLMLQWGTVNMSFADGSQSALIPFTPAFSNVPYSIMATPIVSQSNDEVISLRVKTGSVTAIDFRLVGRGENNTHNVYWMAIGPA